VSDWRDDDQRNDDWAQDWAPPTPREGARVVRDPEHEAYAPAPPGADPYARDATTPAGRFALPEEDASWSASGGGPVVSAPPPGDVQLPHWSEPPTGEVPQSLGGGGPTGDDLDSWSSLSGPRFRVGDADWAEEDFGDLRKDSSTSIGALADDEMWAEPPARRGRRGRRGRREPVDAPPPVAPDPYGGDQHGGEQPGGEPYVAEQYPADQYAGGGYGAEQYGEYQEEQPAGPADLTSRVVTAVIVAAIALAAFAAGRPAATFLVTVIVGACAFELYEAFRRAGYHTATVLGLLGCVAIVPVAYNQGERAFPLVTLLVVVFTFLWYLLEVVRARPTINIALTLMVFLWIGFLGAFAGMLLAPDPGGTGLLLGVVICAVGADVVAYFAGRAIGRTPLLPEVSPNKTIEGLVAGAVAAIVLGGIVGSVLHPWADKGIGAGLALGLIVAITAPLGDLAESLVKRDLGLKDLGSFLPGHGGFLDRFDAILFTLPAAYYLAIQVFS
jgi:phosphatidate cytidylyltransferase